MGREVVRFRFRVAADAPGIRFVLVQVVRDWTEVVEELAQQVPAATLAHHAGAEELVSGSLDGLLEQDAPAAEVDIAEPLVSRSTGTVVGAGCRGEPALVDTAAVSAERVKVAGIELEAATGHEEGTGHPTGSKPHDAAALVESFADG